MGIMQHRSWKNFAGLFGLMVLLALGGGCQTGQSVSSQALIRHQAMIDFSGLNSAEEIESVQVRCALPQRWEEMPLQKNPLYTHQQWRSPHGGTGLGVIYIRLPLPLNAKTLVWLAKTEYTKKENDGRLIDKWTDAVGRNWFEAENNRYHARGYAVTRGFEAWIVYFGYRAWQQPSIDDLSLAARAAQTLIPLPMLSRHAELSATE